VARERGWRRRQLVPGDGPLARVPPPVAFLVVGAVFAAGVDVGGALGAALLAGLALLIAALLAAAWPWITPAERILRVVVLLIVVAIGLTLLG
jgi:hypothetical protein